MSIWGNKTKIISIISSITSGILFIGSIIVLAVGISCSFEEKYQNLTLINKQSNQLNINKINLDVKTNTKIIDNNLSPNGNDIVKIGISSINFGNISINNRSNQSFESTFYQHFKTYDQFVSFAKNSINNFQAQLNQAMKDNNSQNIIKYRTLINLCNAVINTNTLIIVGATFTSFFALVLIASIIIIFINKKKSND